MPETVRVERRKRAPIVETLYDHWRIVVGFAGLSVFSAVGFYVSFVYLVSWLQTADGIPPSRALEINSFSMAIGQSRRCMCCPSEDRTLPHRCKECRVVHHSKIDGRMAEMGRCCRKSLRKRTVELEFETIESRQADF
jgi:hypothetical protein